MSKMKNGRNMFSFSLSLVDKCDAELHVHLLILQKRTLCKVVSLVYPYLLLPGRKEARKIKNNITKWKAFNI